MPVHFENDELVQLTGAVLQQTQLAILFFDGVTDAWVPKSQINSYEDLGGDLVDISIPRWLAEEKELI